MPIRAELRSSQSVLTMHVDASRRDAARVRGDVRSEPRTRHRANAGEQHRAIPEPLLRTRLAETHGGSGWAGAFLADGGAWCSTAYEGDALSVPRLRPLGPPKEIPWPISPALSRRDSLSPCSWLARPRLPLAFVARLTCGATQVLISGSARPLHTACEVPCLSDHNSTSDGHCRLPTFTPQSNIESKDVLMLPNDSHGIVQVHACDRSQHVSMLCASMIAPPIVTCRVRPFVVSSRFNRSFRAVGLDRSARWEREGAEVLALLDRRPREERRGKPASVSCPGTGKGSGRALRHLVTQKVSTKEE